MSLGKRAWELLLQLTEFKSVSESAGEGEIARFIHARLGNNPYFQSNPGLLHLLPLPAANSPAVVAALVRGRSKKTVVLINHHDVVGTEDYGGFEPLAFSPLALTAKLGPAALTPTAAADLAGGQWVFGRGTMDMLFGVGLQLELIQDQARRASSMESNLLFLSVPDEENNSLGMRHAIGILRQLQAEHGLDYAAFLNCEPHGDEGNGHVIQTGSDGKLLPLLYVVGRETHAGAIYEGLNPHLLLAEIIRLLELNPGFCDQNAGVVTMPPTVLQAGDTKRFYNVSTPTAAWAFVNLFTLKMGPEQMLARLVRLCQQAAANVGEKILRSARAWQKLAGSPPALAAEEIKVLDYAELKQIALINCANLDAILDARAVELDAQGATLQQLTLELVAETHRRSCERGPKIIIALAPPFYPPVSNRRQDAKEQQAMAAVAALQDYARTIGVQLGHEEYLRGISDLSYCSLQDATAAVTLADNCPAWGRGYYLPFADLACIDAPVLNLGPWGRDVHKHSERIHRPFATETLPLLFQRLVELLLA